MPILLNGYSFGKFFERIGSALIPLIHFLLGALKCFQNRICVNGNFMAERQRNSLESRVKEIDKIIRCLYEDRVVGRITPERYDELACGYELEQTEIKQELESITARIAEMDMRDICVKEFIANAKEIVDMDKLTPKILRAFVLRIDVYEKEEKFSRKCGNYIEIHYTFQPKPRTTSKTAVSTIAVIPMELQMAALNA